MLCSQSGLVLLPYPEVRPAVLGPWAHQSGQAPERVRVDTKQELLSLLLTATEKRESDGISLSLTHSAEVNSVGRVESAKFGRRLKFKAAVVAQAGAKC